MTGGYSYDSLPPLYEESQDLAEGREYSFDLASTLYSPDSRQSGYDSPQSKDADTKDGASIRSSSTGLSSSSSGVERIKKGLGLTLLRRKAVGSWRSDRKKQSYETEYARVGKGWWKDQLLSDRSIRGMAVLTAIFAIIMITVVAANAKLFRERPNKNSTSVGGKEESCSKVQRTNSALLVLINIAATMILGMSNTYQQMVTSLKIGDIKYVLSKYGDTRVGTNSPFAINHKREGKLNSWLAWLILISTSLPVHFLSNSMIGPSMVFTPPKVVQYNATSYKDYLSGHRNYEDPSSAIYPDSFICWSALRTGQSRFPLDGHGSSSMFDGMDSSDSYFTSATMNYARIVVSYAQENCSTFVNNTDVIHAQREYNNSLNPAGFMAGNCNMGYAVSCFMYEPTAPKCRLNIRMQAAFILGGCLVIKAIYMITVNLLARGKTKRQCLTFGDVIVASASDPELRVKDECMVNAAENYRRQTNHTCHKHCAAEPSDTGDEIGHCQKCKKFNVVNKFVPLPQPTIATKIKKSLISNLGNTALTQMSLLFICSLVMLMGSIIVADITGSQYGDTKSNCKQDRNYVSNCNSSDGAVFASISGGWGGFNSSLQAASLPADEISSELLSFCISNGAQFIYSLLYLMLIYNITLICQERDWGNLETAPRRLRCTIVTGEAFEQDYLLQLPKHVLFHIMGYSILTHWMIGEALQTQETIWRDTQGGFHSEHSQYTIVYAAYPLWFATALVLFMTGLCWWAFTYRREGFIPQMFGSIRTCCAATSELDDFTANRVQWGDLGMGEKFRHAGLSAGPVGKIHPNELYAGRGEQGEETHRGVRKRAPHDGRLS